MAAKIKKILWFILCLALPLLVGYLSSLLSGDIRGTYEGMAKIPLSPPGWLFGIVWPVLYILMGIASYLVLQSQIGKKQKTAAITVYLLQLLVNGIWSIVFFRAGSLWLAFAVIIVLDALVAVCFYLFRRATTAAGALLIPYMAWIAFATYLNVGFAVVN